MSTIAPDRSISPDFRFLGIQSFGQRFGQQSTGREVVVDGAQSTIARSGSQGAARRGLNWLLCIAVLVIAAAIGAKPAQADRSTFRTYDADQGLASLGGSCLLQDRVGYILVCTEHGVFAYDGRRFANLGLEQGLRQGGDVRDIVLTATGRIAVGYPDEVFVSDRPTDAAHLLNSLSFRPILHPGVTFYAERVHHLAAWQAGLALIAGDNTEKVVVPEAGAPRVETMGYNLEERGFLSGATGIFSIEGRLWESFEDGRLCIANPGAVKCFGAAEGLRRGPWVDVVAGAGHQVLARSTTSVATFDPASGRWTVADLPDQAGRYVNYHTNLGLFRTPDGGLMTQAEHGLAVLGANGWRLLTVEDGAPPGIIMSALTDATGQFWFQIFGRGLVRWIGYGHWETLQKADGLSDGIPWETARSPNGALWVSTDSGVDQVVRRGSSLLVSRLSPGASFAITAGPHGELWRSAADGVTVVDPRSGTETKIALPLVNVIVSGLAEAVWIGTQAGLFEVEDHPGTPLRAVLQGSPRTEIVSVVGDGTGGVFYLSSGRLRHRRQDGIDVPVGGEWPDDGFEPLALAIGHNGDIWIGGAGGLYDVVVSADRVVSYKLVATSDTRTNSIVAVMVDHRGWVWAGTAAGVSVFNGERWVSVDADGGLVSDDVDQGGIRADPDGSVWITTTQGLSHLIDPAWLFADRPIKVVVSGALLGTHPVTGDPMAYTTDQLLLQFGTPNYSAEHAFVFHYRLSDVDANWAASSNGQVRYAFVPPGRHVLTVIGYDELTHRSSPPASLVVDVAFPWWRQWWFEIASALGAVGLIYGLMLWRFRAVLARQAELKRHVAKATEQLRYDRLTGLLNRCEVERRLADKLSGGSLSEEMFIALVDIDHFKRVNDSHGHLGGDDVLRVFGRLISRTVRDGEFAGRYGGEEMLLVLDDSDGRGAERVLALHHMIRGSPFDAAGKSIRVTCSIGLAWAVRGDGWESLIGRADDALYEAKASGRDQVVERGRAGPVMRGGTNERRARPRF